MIAPDVERVDTMKTDNGYEIRYVCRQQRQCALLPDGLSGTASFAGPVCLSAEMPYRKVDLDQAARNVLSQEQFAQDGGEGTVASWRNTVTSATYIPTPRWLSV